jgi:hypothetical protein
MVVHTCNPSYLGGGDRRMAVRGQHMKNSGTSDLKNQLKAKGLGS